MKLAFASTEPVTTNPLTVLADMYGNTSAPIAVASAALITQNGAAVIAAANTTVHVVVADAPIRISPAFDRLPAATVPLEPAPQAPEAIVGTLPAPTRTLPVEDPTIKSPALVLIAGLVELPASDMLLVDPLPIVAVPEILAVPVAASALVPIVAPPSARLVPTATPSVGVTKVGLAAKPGFGYVPERTPPAVPDGAVAGPLESICCAFAAVLSNRPMTTRKRFIAQSHGYKQ